ncbi:MAG: ATP-binding protein [Gemmataceae bacterium]|nr:ATP-binding protein [Gemmataceae bacterium]
MAVGSAAATLPWLCPRTENLIALADAPGELPQRAREDPALALFLYRFARPHRTPGDWSLLALQAARLPAAALGLLQRPARGVIPWTSHFWNRLWQWALQAARQATGLADRCRLAHPVQAYFAALLAPLGWYAVATIDVHALGDVLCDPKARSAPRRRQRLTWGADHTIIARRLALRWRLPSWLASVCGTLHLPWSAASSLASHAALFALVQWTWMELERSDPTALALGLTTGADRKALLQILNQASLVVPATLPGQSSSSPCPDQTPAACPLRSPPEPSTATCSSSQPTPPFGGQKHAAVADKPGTLPQRQEPGGNPYEQPLLIPLMRQAVGHRRRQATRRIASLQAELDRLYKVIEHLQQQAAQQLQQAKLAALAEFAAGAAHEINNPLAVIATQVQNLLRKETDPQRREGLQLVRKQVYRIADLLRDVLTFARPPQPHRQPVALTELLLAVQRETRSTFEQCCANLRLTVDDSTLMLHVDPQQVQRALTAVLLNAAEVSRNGTVQVKVIADHNQVHIYVEDSGPGLAGSAAEHAFDPFYSGKEAGRGRGLGLPLAWRLVRQNKGDLCYAPLPHLPGRFHVRLPRWHQPAMALKQSA